MADEGSCGCGDRLQCFCWLLFAVVWAWLALRASVANTCIAAVCVYFATREYNPSMGGLIDAEIELTVLLCLASAIEKTRWRWGFFGLAIALTVLLCFIKWNAALFCAAAILLWCMGMYWVDRAAAIRGLMYGGTFGIAGFVAGFAIVTGKPIAVVEYLRGSFEEAAGFNAAMSIADPPGLWRQILMVTIPLVGFLAVLVYRRSRAGMVMGLVILGPLFFAYKHAIVRSDGHRESLFLTIPMLIAAICAVALMLFLPGGKKEAA